MAVRRGRLVVLAGPSGVGKGTLVRRLIDRIPHLVLSVSVTTRERRPIEREGVEYLFVSDAEFDRMSAAGELLEWAEIFGHRSGTPAEPVRRALEQGRDVLLELDVQGAAQVRAREPAAVLILLEPPTLDELARRLRSRGTEDEASIARRLAKATWELEQRNAFDHAVVNDDVDRATGEVAAIIEAFPQVNDPTTEGTTHP
ncbi:MAG TPA: guanylate kinase [Actinomycetota bacterium]